ncbi:MAG: hypothetical protein JRN08_06220 [Nitrososphaerota archaeon]|nr:hypothetical protein [Nitrososphaerota archaeon]
MSGQPAEAEQTVRRLFSVKEMFVLPDGELEFQVAFDAGTKEKFAELKSSLAGVGLRPELTGSSDDCVLTLRKVEPAAKNLPRLPAIFAFFTAAALIVMALFQQEVYQVLMPSWPDYFGFFAFALTVAALLGAHRLGQTLMARTRDAGHASSFLIPYIPLLPPYIPSLGFVSSQRAPALNKDALFDTVVAGPLAMLFLAILLFAVGEVTAVQSAVPFASTNLVNTTVTINPSLIQVAVGSLLGPFTHAVAPGYTSVSPLQDGSFVGFTLAFMCFLPMASYDGGIMAHLALGQRGAKVASYLSIIALLAFDTWTYLAVAVVVLLLVGRPFQLKLQDEVSPLSSSRRWLLVGTVVLAFLCIPLPHSIATLPL